MVVGVVTCTFPDSAATTLLIVGLLVVIIATIIVSAAVPFNSSLVVFVAEVFLPSSFVMIALVHSIVTVTSLDGFVGMMFATVIFLPLSLDMEATIRIAVTLASIVVQFDGTKLSHANFVGVAAVSGYSGDVAGLRFAISVAASTRVKQIIVAKVVILLPLLRWIWVIQWHWRQFILVFLIPILLVSFVAVLICVNSFLAFLPFHHFLCVVVPFALICLGHLLVKFQFVVAKLCCLFGYYAFGY